VPFEEWANELLVVASLNTYGCGGAGKPSPNRATTVQSSEVRSRISDVTKYLISDFRYLISGWVVAISRPETGWPSHGQVEAGVTVRGGPHPPAL